MSVLLRPLLALLLLAVLFAGVERVAPVLGRRRTWWEARRDAAWFLLDAGVRGLARGLTVLLLLAVALLLGWELTEASFRGFGPLGSQPRAVQAVEILVLSDGLGYLLHRAFHTVPWLWRIHAVHHASTHLDWLAAARAHPLNALLTRPLQAVPLVLLGFDPTSVAVVVPLLGVWAIALHADVRWRLGPLRHVLASPAFHRWHHAPEPGLRNLAGLLPVWDLLGGTFHLPEEDALRSGLDDLEVPDGILAQLRFPFRAG
ncbi:MAG: sterol desaturase family protein [Alphaproteobacteria bacterium]|nr:sterol desaturase family protein [Alphaproteobacteria bacterium]